MAIKKEHAESGAMHSFKNRKTILYFSPDIIYRQGMKSEIFKICVLIAALCFMYPMQASQSAAQCNDPFVLSTTRLSRSLPSCDIFIERPHLGHKDADALMSTWLNQQRDSFTLKSSSSPDPDHWPYSLEVSLGESHDLNHYASLKFDILEYTGGAHPNHYIGTFVFDKKSGVPLTLTDLFIDTDTALKAISRLTADQIRRQRKRELSPMEQGGLYPSAQHYQYFALTRKGVHFFFPPYQIGSYSEGEQQVHLSRTSVRPWIKPAILQNW